MSHKQQYLSIQTFWTDENIIELPQEKDNCLVKTTKKHLQTNRHNLHKGQRQVHRTRKHNVNHHLYRQYFNHNFLLILTQGKQN